MLRGLLAHKLRLVLAALTVVLGTMFMSGAFIGGDTITQGFNQLFSTVNGNLDGQVTARDSAPGGDANGLVTTFVDAGTVHRVRAVPGVRSAIGHVSTGPARVVGRNGKVVGTSSAPQLGTGWLDADPTGLAQLRSGHPPTGPDQVAFNETLAKRSGYRLGDRVDVITRQPRRSFTLVGIFGYAGGRDSLGGETTVAFTLPVAQQLMLGVPDAFTAIDVQAQPGVPPRVLTDRIAGALGAGYLVRTGAQTAADQAGTVRGVVTGLKIGLTVFALIGLFTGGFLIFNTFATLVAQRTRELALYRSFGASRGQLNRAVLLEAVLLGLVSSTIGLLLGLGVGWLLKTALSTFARVDLPVSGIVLRPYVVIWTLLVGVLCTVLAALAPAWRASRVPPIAAMRDAAAPDRLTGRGAVVFGIVSRPVTGGLGRIFAGSVPGRLGVRNAGRNPRRTAITAAALMIGVALATGAGVFASSAKAGISDALHTDLHAQLVVSTANGGTGTGGFTPARGARLRAIPGVSAALELRRDQISLDGHPLRAAATDVPVARQLIGLRARSGQVRQPAAGELLVDEDTARSRHYAVGQTLSMVTARGGTHPVRVIGIFATNQLAGGPIVSDAAAAGFRSPYTQLGFVQVGNDGAVRAVRARLDALFADNPEVTVSTSEEFTQQGAGMLDVLLVILNVLLGLTIVVAVLGVINTLLLSIHERTREIGLIRAIGMSRGQLTRMITVESVLISVFGALLGIVVGMALGVAVVAAVDSGGLLRLTIPWAYLGITLILSVVAGVLAAILPAIRAGRLNVLAAIAYE
jgi:putative ABC transport system permease protein